MAEEPTYEIIEFFKNGEILSHGLRVGFSEACDLADFYRETRMEEDTEGFYVIPYRPSLEESKYDLHHL